MWFWILTIYLIQLFPIFILPIWKYKEHRGENMGKRRAIIESIQVALICFIPILPLIAVFYSTKEVIKEKLEKWIEEDPTDPINLKNPDFKPPEKKKKKKKKDKPIFNRSEILDL